MSEDFDEYDAFSKEMHEKFPVMFSRPYGGFCIGEGWWQIVRNLCSNIQSHIDWKNETRATLLKDNPYNHKIPDQVEQVYVAQIKEKFGGLRFYYEGGDATIDGMVTMAEAWAANTCEECGAPGVSRSGGWIRTLCDVHEKERQENMRKRFGEEE